ncbi:MAG: group II intron reverse transcriptase/maturase [Elusimicrobia bacterium]|nr:group II intron reverse transcriptase/maturase [Elusimicrobiota bacterium]
MDGADADKMAEMAEPHRKEAAGSRHEPGQVRQTSAAGKEEASSKTTTLMEQVVGRENLKRALRRVVSNKGAPGPDGMTVEELTPFLKAHWPRLRGELLESRYVPKPVRAVDIPKPGGGTRRLGVPTVLDRFIQQAVLQVLTPVFDPAFSQSSFGYRPGRSAQGAVAAGRRHVEEGFRWVVDMDVEKFFDRVNHDVLMARVARKVEDKRLLKLVRAYLNAGIMVEGVAYSRIEGTPQGGPLSPLLSNILLDDLDKELERRGHRFCRYADDANVYVRSKAAGERVMESMGKFLERRLRLRLNRNKSVVDRPWKRTFLGYSMTPNKEPKLKVARDALQRARGDLRQLFRRGRGRSLTRVIGEINQFTRGWTGYFRLAQTKNVFEEMDDWLRRRCRWLLWRQWKRPRTRFKKMVQLGLAVERAKASAGNGRGPWWNAGASHMNASVPTAWLAAQGLMSLSVERRRLEVAV